VTSRSGHFYFYTCFLPMIIYVSFMSILFFYASPQQLNDINERP
jgi:hypothetical protein